MSTNERSALDAVNSLDLAFVVDTTGSMGGLISTAQQQMIHTIDEVSTAEDVALRVGLVEYRDHPPQETSFVTRVHPFVAELDKAQQMIDRLRVNGGGDQPEAVLDGVLAASRQLEWRRYARCIAILIGDAPPHGTGCRGDSFAQGCPCRETITSTTAVTEESRITLYALGLNASATESFTRLSVATGGEYFSVQHGGGNNAIERIKQILKTEFGSLAFDRRVLSTIGERITRRREYSLDELAVELESSRPAVAASMGRLGGRGLLASSL